MEKEVSKGELLDMPLGMPLGGWTEANIRLPSIPVYLDSTGTATKRYDTRSPKKARRTCGKGSPETMPEYSFNFHCAPESRWFKLCLPTVRTHAECAAILYHPAKAMGQELTGAAADFEGFYT